MLRMKYLVTLTLIALLLACGAAFADPFVALEYETPVTPTSVPIPNDFTEQQFDDIDTDFWAWAQIEECSRAATAAEDFIVQGYGDGTYQPTYQVTRGQMAVFVARAAGFTDDAPDTPSFQDVPDTYWAFTEVERCVANGVVQGYADYFGDGIDAYLPSAVVDRGQMAVYLYRAAGLTTAAYAGTFDDVDEDFWAALEIEACATADIAQGFGDGTYLPGNAVTRAQMAVFVWRALVRGDGDVILGGPGVTDDYAPGDGVAALYYPDEIAGATGANTADLEAGPGAVVFIVLDAAQVGGGDITFELADSAATVDTDTLNPAGGDAAVDAAAGLPYLVAAYQIDSGLAAEDYTLTLTLGNGYSTTWEFTVE